MTQARPTDPWRTIERHPDWINPDADLHGVDGNAFAVLGHVDKALKRAGNSKEVRDRYFKDAQALDYDHLLAVSAKYCGMTND